MPLAIPVTDCAEVRSMKSVSTSCVLTVPVNVTLPPVPTLNGAENVFGAVITVSVKRNKGINKCNFSDTNKIINNYTATIDSTTTKKLPLPFHYNLHHYNMFNLALIGFLHRPSSITIILLTLFLEQI